MVFTVGVMKASAGCWSGEGNNQICLLKNHSKCNIKSRMEERVDVERLSEEIIPRGQARDNSGLD